MAGLAGVLGEGEAEPLDEPEEEEPEELEELDPPLGELEAGVEDDEAGAVEDFAFVEGNGVNGLRGAPEC